MLTGAIAALVLAVAGIWFLTATDDDDDETIRIDATGPEAPSLGTNAAVTGEPLPDVTLPDVDGKEVDVAELAGQPLILNFWYADCAPCKREMPVLAATAKALDGQARFVGVNTADSARRARDFADEYGADYLQLLDPNGELLTATGVGLLPTTLFVDSDGRIVVLKAGELTQKKLDATIAEAFGPLQ